MKDSDTPFLGSGWAFPPAFNKLTHSVEMSHETDDIQESIRIILGTIPGERIMNPTFGCGINKYVFESRDTTQMTMLKDAVYDALLYFEPRISIENIDILGDQDHDGLIKIHIDYTVIVTNSRSNIVFPYYLKEGTNI